jgi:hypothetical protein
MKILYYLLIFFILFVIQFTYLIDWKCAVYKETDGKRQCVIMERR